MFRTEELNVVLQKEYLIISSDDGHPVLATESVRGCCVVAIFHPTQSAILHWDDDSCHLELSKFVGEFTQGGIPLTACTVHLIGGWRDNTESRKSCEFVKNFFELNKVELSLDYFLEKKSIGTFSQQGYSLVAIDSRNGSVYALSDWRKPILDYTDGKYRGVVDPHLRTLNTKHVMLYHMQSDDDLTSGSRIYSRDKFAELTQCQANQLCIAAKENNIDGLIQMIEEGITSINVAPTAAKGWTPLHYACKFMSIEAAHFLVKHGAKLYQKNEAGRTPLDCMLANPLERRRLVVAYNLISFSTAHNQSSLRSFSLFARGHEQVLESAIREQLVKLNDSLQHEEGLQMLERQFK